MTATAELATTAERTGPGVAVSVGCDHEGGCVNNQRCITTLLVACVWCQGPLDARQDRGGAAGPQKNGPTVPTVKDAPAGEDAKNADAKNADAKNVNPSGATLLDFKKRIDTYLRLQRQMAGDTPPLKQTNDPAEISAAEHALEAKIRAARTDAQPGDIFTPEIRAEFRKLLAQPMKGETKTDAKAVVKDDAPASVPLKVNARYPDGATLPTVPTALLKNLPTLPPELEYRIIERHLILRDTKANIIVDFIPNAMALG
jgi:hypothetical protein